MNKKENNTNSTEITEVWNGHGVDVAQETNDYRRILQNVKPHDSGDWNLVLDFMGRCWRSVSFCFKTFQGRRETLNERCNEHRYKRKNQGDSYRLFFKFWNLIICQLFPIDWMAPFKVRNLSCFYLKWVQLFRASFVASLVIVAEVTAWHEWRQREQRLRDQTLARIQRANAEKMGKTILESEFETGKLAKDLNKFDNSVLHGVS